VLTSFRLLTFSPSTPSPVHPHLTIFTIFPKRQIPPFNQQQHVQAMSCDIAVLLNDWFEEAKRSRQSHSYGGGLGSSVSGVGAGVREDEFPVFRIDQAIDQYLAELEPSRTETRAMYEGVKRQLRRSF
jgi:nuclear pore complex protein Nup155